MEELKKMYTEAEEKLHNKGFYVDNMADFENEFEVCNADGEVVIDHLSLAQLEQLSKML